MAHNFIGFGLSGNVDDNPETYREFCRREAESRAPYRAAETESPLVEEINALTGEVHGEKEL